MYCRNCGAEMDDKAAICVKCGFAKGKGTAYCQNCGEQTSEGQAVCMKCGFKLSGGAVGGDFIANVSGAMDGFTRISEGKIISGVCTGLGAKYNLSPWIFRAAFVFLPLWPIWLILYVVLAGKPIQ